MKIIKHQKTKKGFSLMEILVVLFIVSTTLLGVVSLIIQNIQVQSINKNNLVASSLAQEGIEIVRQVRDINWQNGWSFNTFLNDGSYRVDYRLPVVIPIGGVSDTKLYLKDGMYVSDNGSDSGLTPTIYSRQIVISRLVSYSGRPLQVRSIVSWTDHNRPYRYELQTLLFDWR